MLECDSMEALLFLAVWAALLVGSAVIYFVFDRLASTWPDIGALFYVAGLGTWILFIKVLYDFHETHQPKRPKPEGYVGRFRRSDGRVVHVARLKDGKLMVASDTQPPRDLGSVDGRELIRWTKLATTPDGNECLPGSQ